MEERRAPEQALGHDKIQKPRRSRGENKGTKKKQPRRKEEEQESSYGGGEENVSGKVKAIYFMECCCKVDSPSLQATCYVTGSVPGAEDIKNQALPYLQELRI